MEDHIKSKKKANMAISQSISDNYLMSNGIKQADKNKSNSNAQNSQAENGNVDQN